MTHIHHPRRRPGAPLARRAIAALLAASAGGPIPAGAATLRIPPDTRIQDLGPAAPGHVKTFMVGLRVRHQAAMEARLAAVTDPRSELHRKFITPAQFAAQYGQPAQAIEQVTGYLRSQGFTVDTVYANQLLIRVTGTNARIAATFGTPIHRYSFGGGAYYEAPAGRPVIPSRIAPVVSAVSGLSTRAFARSHRATVPRTGALAAALPPRDGPPSAGADNAAGAWTVRDFAARYNVLPLYARGVDGTGATLGIITLAGYDQGDAYAYWRALGLPVQEGRITDVLVDGGALPADGPASPGAAETTLDVEQSGGIAPGAVMRVYIGPNASSGFFDAFAQAVNENLVDVLSVSWGSPEVSIDPDTLDLFHEVFEQAALQGIPVIAAAGDAGAFDVNGSYAYPGCTTLLSVDHPAADPWVLAAGGTTLPNTYPHRDGPVTVAAERPWGWDYLQSYVIAHDGQAMYYSDYFTVGGGGGVSVQFAVPAWQAGLPGVQRSAPAQSLWSGPSLDGAGLDSWVDFIDLPAGTPGRNLPDVALNADPFSGYAVYQGGWSGYEGGTSFVAPQLNGVLSLITAELGGRLGAAPPQLYRIFSATRYGAGSPFRAITHGDNEYYPAAAHYNPASGLGSLDANALATALGAQ